MFQQCINLCLDIILQHDWPIEQCPLHNRVFFGGKTKSPCFELFIHWLILKQITTTYQNHFKGHTKFALYIDSKILFFILGVQELMVVNRYRSLSKVFFSLLSIRFSLLVTIHFILWTHFSKIWKQTVALVKRYEGWTVVQTDPTFLLVIQEAKEVRLAE